MTDSKFRPGPSVRVPTLSQLVSVLDDQSQLDMKEPLSQEHINNLTYAYRLIAPVTHTECAFVVWAGNQWQDITNLIDEYCRRRRGEPSQMFDHNLLSLETWCQPRTERIFVFREQLQALSKELTGLDIAFKIHNGTSGSGCTLEMFYERLCPYYKETLSQKMIEEFYQYIRCMYATSREYSWCSALVESAACNSQS